MTMTIHIVTDSTSDISPELARENGITVVPALVRFGNEQFRDGVDLTPDEFYRRLQTSPYHPSTSQPSPADFAAVFETLAPTSSGIICITISSKLSGIYNSAVQGKSLTYNRCPIEVVDSGFNSVGLGLVVLATARSARLGAEMEDILNQTSTTLKQIHMLGVFDTMKYLVRGGRVTKIKAAAAALLGVKPMLTFKNGEVSQAGLVRTYSRGLNRLADFVKGFSKVSDLAIAHSQVPERVAELKSKLEGVFPVDRIWTADLGPTLGAHGGPGVLLIALIA
jgi:DegV family protein with EDD domain